jgi:hypothetical protein
VACEDTRAVGKPARDDISLADRAVVQPVLSRRKTLESNDLRAELAVSTQRHLQTRASTQAIDAPVKM